MKNPEKEPEPTKEIDIFFNLPPDVFQILAIKNGSIKTSELIKLFSSGEIKPIIMIDWMGRRHDVQGWRLREEAGEQATAYLYVGKDVYAIRRSHNPKPTLTNEPQKWSRKLEEEGRRLFREKWFSDGKIPEEQHYKLIKTKQFLTSTGVKVTPK